MKPIDIEDMRHFWFVGRYLVWTGVRFPWLHIRKRERGAEGSEVDGWRDLDRVLGMFRLDQRIAHHRDYSQKRLRSLWPKVSRLQNHQAGAAMTYLTCPYCDSPDHEVVDSRGKGGRRRRHCLNAECDMRWTTQERILPPRPEYRHRVPARGQMELGF